MLEIISYLCWNFKGISPYVRLWIIGHKIVHLIPPLPLSSRRRNELAFTGADFHQLTTVIVGSIRILGILEVVQHLLQNKIHSNEKKLKDSRIRTKKTKDMKSRKSMIRKISVSMNLKMKNYCINAETSTFTYMKILNCIQQNFHFSNSM